MSQAGLMGISSGVFNVTIVKERLCFSCGSVGPREKGIEEGPKREVEGHPSWQMEVNLELLIEI